MPTPQQPSAFSNVTSDADKASSVFVLSTTSENFFESKAEKHSDNSLSAESWIGISLGIVAFLIGVSVTTFFLLKRCHVLQKTAEQDKISKNDTLNSQIAMNESCNASEINFEEVECRSANNEFTSQSICKRSDLATKFKTYLNAVSKVSDSVTNKEDPENINKEIMENENAFDAKKSTKITENVLCDLYKSQQNGIDANESLEETHNEYCVIDEPKEMYAEIKDNGEYHTLGNITESSSNSINDDEVYNKFDR